MLFYKGSDGALINLESVAAIGLATHATDRKVDEGTAKLMLRLPSMQICAEEGPEEWVSSVHGKLVAWLGRPAKDTLVFSAVDVAGPRPVGKEKSRLVGVS